MPTIHVVCPFCKKHLEGTTGGDLLQGYCPSCDNIFDPYAAEASTHVSAPKPPPEYAMPGVKLLSLGLAGSMTLLALSGFVAWGEAGEAAVAGLKAAVVAVSLACAVLLGVTRVGRQSLAPAVLISIAWALAASVWTIGALAVAGGDSGIGAGLYLGILLACLTFCLGVYLAVQMRTAAMRRMPLFLAAAVGLGVLGGILGIVLHAAPAFGT